MPLGFLEDEHPNKAISGQASAASCLLPHGSMTSPLVASFIFHEGLVILVVSRLEVSLGAPLILTGRSFGWEDGGGASQGVLKSVSTARGANVSAGLGTMCSGESRSLAPLLLL